MNDSDTFHAILRHDGVEKSADLPLPADRAAPPRIRVHAVDSSGARVIDVFILKDAEKWPTTASYTYLASIPD
ncbi:hypothetical protein [Leifsonia sp. NPDC077715]|uniref:hypothetical protein n=1 Tax=Leifsonia sp. NPDC077715 TaxID=3155539 RepID=UPI003417E162